MKEAQLQSTARLFSIAEIAREVLGDAVRILRAEDIDVMPLKGVLLQSLVYADAIERPLKDVDIAVRSRDFDAAYRAFLRAGYRVVREEPGLYEVAVRAAQFPISVDLHRSFSPTRRFRLTPDAMFTRGRRDETLFGCPVVIPDDYDLFAHLLAHAVLDFLVGAGWHRPQDFAAVSSARRLDPAECARRLEEHGLARFARLGFAPTTPMGADVFASQVLRRLPPDALGAALAAAALRFSTARPAGRVARRVVGVLLNPSLKEVGQALLEAMKERSRRAISTVRH